MKKQLKVLELFGGIGAPKKALKNLGIDHKSIDYVEILKYAVVAYNSIHPFKYLAQDIREWNLEVELVIHGSPCQDFSNAGLLKGGEIGSGTRSSLLWETIRVIEELKTRPAIIIWENVKGVLNKLNFGVFKAYLDALVSLGYVNQYRVLNAIDFGVPQNRERVFVISILGGSGYSFNFDNLEKKEMKPLVHYLDKEPDKRYILTQPSMLKAIEQKKIKVITNNCQTITTKQMRWNNAGVIKMGNTFRVLSPRECWLLMGFENSDYESMLENNIPETYQYLLAGNSIVVPVLEAIFKELFL